VYEFDSSTAEKFSRHLTLRLPGHAFANNHAMGKFVAQVGGGRAIPAHGWPYCCHSQGTRGTEQLLEICPCCVLYFACICVWQVLTASGNDLMVARGEAGSGGGPPPRASFVDSAVYSK
jgi:hypothetical protein